MEREFNQSFATFDESLKACAVDKMLAITVADIQTAGLEHQENK